MPSVTLEGLKRSIAHKTLSHVERRIPIRCPVCSFPQAIEGSKSQLFFLEDPFACVLVTSAQEELCASSMGNMANTLKKKFWSDDT